MAGETLDFDVLLSRDHIAEQISSKYSTWSIQRQQWLDEKRELRNYLFATDTTTTTNKQLPWKNKTTLPKLTQIRDNLHANYMSALFPHSQWFKWEGRTPQDQEKEKRLAVQAYMENKVEQSGFEITTSKLIYDYIDYGNCFCTTEWCEEYIVDEVTGEEIPGYIGPKLVRINPYDIVFNPTAVSFVNSPKIIRSIKTLGEIKRDYERLPDDTENKNLYKEAIQDAVRVRTELGSVGVDDIANLDRFSVDGFGNLHEYYGSGYVEILQFHGDLYDMENDTFYEDYIITIIDRSKVVKMEQSPRWTRKQAIKHVGWRERQENLYAMGPLDNLVGMQYRIDHLENLKADVFDLIAFPVQKIRGNVEEYEYGPNERIHVGEEGDVEFMRPDATALNADFQIRELEQKMEELAGAPREAMGIRTPGEKTKFEVQTLANASGRIFQAKITQFERLVIEPVLNDMLELSRRNISGSDIVRVMEDDQEVVSFLTITPEDLSSSGKLKARGASHFARRANQLQELVQVYGTILAADPAISTHISGFKVAKLIESLMDLERHELVSENVRVEEQAETQKLIATIQENIQVQSLTPTGLLGDEE